MSARPAESAAPPPGAQATAPVQRTATQIPAKSPVPTPATPAAGPTTPASPGPVPLRAPDAFGPVLPAPAGTSAPPAQRTAPAAPSPEAVPSVTRLRAPAAPALPSLPVPVQRAAVPAALKSFWKKAVGPSPSDTPGPPPAHTPGPPPPYDPGTPPPYDPGTPPPYDPGPPPPYGLHDPHPGGSGPHAGPSFDPRALTDGQIDELTHRLVGPLTRLLRTELRMDRERIGRLRDPRT
ncbi:extensin [Streptomyces caelestis]|uniref:extensin n=1 Tax=Streptomyces caelestis TaxID=36816 RepID=UPI00364D31DD